MKHTFYTLILIFCAINAHSQTIPFYIPKCGLVAWYPFTGNAIDSSGNAHNGTVYGATLTTDRHGNINSAYSFNGINNYIMIPSGTGGAGLQITGSISISAWAKSSNYTYSANEQIFWRGDATPAHDSYMLYTDAGNVAFRRDVGTGSTTNEIGYPSMGIDTFFHHFVATYDSASGYMSIYFDGALVINTLLPGIESYPTSTFWNMIGAVDVGTWQFFYGSIDDIGIWNRALTPCEVKDLYYSLNICSDTIHSNTDTTVCASEMPVTLYGPAGYSSYVWSTGSTTLSISVGSSGTYSVHAFNSGCGPFVLDTFQLKVVANDTIYKHTDTSLCVSDGPMVLSLPSGYSSYLWSNGSTAPSISASSSGTYWVNAANGCTILTDTFLITNAIKDTIYKRTDTSACTANSPIKLSLPDTYSSYLWSNGSTSSSILVSSYGIYWVDAFSGGCKLFVDTFHTVFISSPIVSLGNDTSICTGTSITLSSLQPINAQYSWSTGSDLSSIKVSDSGNYSLTVTLNGCSTIDSVQITNISAPSVKLGDDTTLCTGENLSLQVNAENTKYLWSDGSNEQNFEITKTGTYWVTLSNKCGNAGDTIKVTYEICDILFPSAFTPNDDGKNDIIRAVGSLAMYTDFTLSIYNRFGQRVFYTQDIYSGWDGVFNGTKQGLGTYFYMMSYSLNGKKSMMKGDFELIR